MESARAQYLRIDKTLDDAHTLLAQSKLSEDAYRVISRSMLELKALVSSTFAAIERERNDAQRIG